MNFVGSLGGNHVRMQLKYCERCGGLWLRREGTFEAYCGNCRIQLAEMLDVEYANLNVTRRQKSVSDNSAKRSCQSKIWGMKHEQGGLVEVLA